MDTNKVFLDSKYVSNLVGKYKGKHKILKTLTIVLTIIVIALATYAILLTLSAIDTLDTLTIKIDSSMDIILKETVKTKVCLNNITKNENVQNSLIELINSSSKCSNIYIDLTNIMSTAMNEVSPKKIIKVTDSLKNAVSEMYVSFLKNKKLSEPQIKLIMDYNRFYNEILYIQSSLVLKSTPKSIDNNEKSLDIDLSSLNSIDNTYQNKYCNGINFTMTDNEWISMMARMGSFIVNKQ